MYKKFIFLLGISSVIVWAVFGVIAIDPIPVEILFDDAQSLTIFINSETAISLNSLSFVETDDDKGEATYPITTFFPELVENQFISAGTCLILEVDTQTSLPSSNDCLKEIITRDSVFWYDFNDDTGIEFDIYENDQRIATCHRDDISCSFTLSPQIALFDVNNLGDPDPKDLDGLIDNLKLRGWQQDYTGEGIRIGIIDQHFSGLVAFPNLTSKQDISIYNDDNFTQGTNVIEVIRKLAPNSEFFVCRYASYNEFTDCTGWMFDNDVHIIHHSSHIPIFKVDGESDWAKEVQIAKEEGILWIDAAGNYANARIEGEFKDTNNNNIAEFSIDGNNEILPIDMIPYTSGTIMLTWDDRNRLANEIDLELRIIDIETQMPIVTSNNQQLGQEGDRPIEIATIDMTNPFGIQIIDVNGMATESPTNFALFIEFADLTDLGRATNETITAPSSSPFALTVGSLQGAVAAPYSSRGDLRDNGTIKKPLIVAPGEIQLDDGIQFIGTNASAAVVTGFAALVWENLNERIQQGAIGGNTIPREEIWDYLLTEAVIPKYAQYDINFGYGYLQPPPPDLPLPTLLPTATPTPVDSVTLEINYNSNNLFIYVDPQANGYDTLSLRELEISGTMITGDQVTVQLGNIYNFQIANEVIEPTCFVLRAEKAKTIFVGMPDRCVPEIAEYSDHLPEGSVPWQDNVNFDALAIISLKLNRDDYQNCQQSPQGCSLAFPISETSPTPTFTLSPTPTATFTPDTTTPSDEDSLTPTFNNQCPSARVNVGFANLREGPGLRHDILSAAFLDDEFVILLQSKDQNWYLIERPNLNPLWIASSVVDVCLHDGTPIQFAEFAMIVPSPTRQATPENTPTFLPPPAIVAGRDVYGSNQLASTPLPPPPAGSRPIIIVRREFISDSLSAEFEWGVSSDSPRTISFTNQSTGNIKRYEWDFDGDGYANSTEKDPTHTYSISGAYEVILTVIDGNRKASTTKTITVMDVPPVADFTASVTSGTEPLAVTFTNHSFGDIRAYEWDFDGDDNPDYFDTDPPAFVYAIPGIYSAKLTISGPGGLNTYEIPITVNSIPLEAGFNIIPPTNNNPLTVTFSNTSTGDIASYAWDFDGDTRVDSDEKNPPPYTYSQAGNYTVSLFIIGENDATDSHVETVGVGSPEASFDVSTQSGLSVTFSNTSTGEITSYEWDFDNDGTVDETIKNPTHTYPQSDTYQAKLTVTGSSGSDTYEETITVTASPPLANFSLTPPTNVNPLTVTFTNTSTGDIDTYDWDFNGDTIIDSTLRNPPAYTYSQAGTYTVSLLVTRQDGDSTTTDSHEETIWVGPHVADFTVSTQSGNAPLSVTFTDTSTGTITSYKWDFDSNGTTDSTNKNPTHVYAQPGVYQAKLTVTGPGGSDDKTLMINVTSSPVTPTPFGIVNNAQGINVRECPGTQYVVQTTFGVGQEVPLLGKNATGNWFKIMSGWIADITVSVQGDITYLPTVQPPVCPTLTPTPSNQCDDGTLHDTHNDPCNHDEDGDGVLENDGERNPFDECPTDPANRCLESTNCEDGTLFDTHNLQCNHDEDGDGVLENDGERNPFDECPTEPAQTTNGCPPQCPDGTPFDTHDDPCNHDEDGDGVLENDGERNPFDECPTVFAQTTNGCPLPPPCPHINIAEWAVLEHNNSITGRYCGNKQAWLIVHTQPPDNRYYPQSSTASIPTKIDSENWEVSVTLGRPDVPESFQIILVEVGKGSDADNVIINWLVEGAEEGSYPGMEALPSGSNVLITRNVCTRYDGSTSCN